MMKRFFYNLTKSYVVVLSILRYYLFDQGGEHSLSAFSNTRPLFAPLVYPAYIDKHHLIELSFRVHRNLVQRRPGADSLNMIAWTSKIGTKFE